MISRMGSDYQAQAAQMASMCMLIACACAVLMPCSYGQEDPLLGITAGLAADMQALLAIKSSLLQQNPNTSLPSNLSNWASNSSSPCAWSRVTCSPSPWLANQTRVTALDLSSLAIYGPLPSGFADLQGLAYLNLSNNGITGPLSPDNIANCTHLLSLDLSSNNLSTSFTVVPPHDDDDDAYPLGLQNLINLQHLDLGSNNMSSSDISLALPLMCAQLQFLNISNNSIHLELSQAYPWHNCSSLHTLDLSYNQFSGSIPPDLATLPSLQNLYLCKNRLVGTIPTSICSSNSSSLQQLDLSENRITGTFPLPLLQCSSLQHLDISGNNITGEIPPQLGKLVSLVFLKLAENNFTGSLPEELGGLANLKVFNAGSNRFSGSIPPQLTNCKELVLIALDSNLLQGPLPDFLGDMVSLRYFGLHDNAFSGTIPLALFNPLSQLVLLDLSGNKLSGTIPAQFANLTSLQYLMLAENNLTGAIPSEMGSMTELQMLDISSNYLTGQIPPSLGRLQHLLWLNLAFNNLTGSIPPQLGNCTSLLWLNLKRNSLSGLLPSELASMGVDPSRTFEINAEKNHYLPKTLGMCAMIKRWVPEDYPPYSFVYDLIQNTDACKSFWLVLISRSPFDEVCYSQHGEPIAKGYVQLSNNQLTGPISYNLQANRTVFLLLSFNRFNGSLPGGLWPLPLLAINASHNMLEGSIPESFADNNECLTSLDLSYNNLSGSIPASLANLHQLSKLNLSFNPFLSGSIPEAGQFSTFASDSFLNDTLLCLEDSALIADSRTSMDVPFCHTSSNNSSSKRNPGRHSKASEISSQALLITGILSGLSVLICGSGALAICIMRKWPSSRRCTSSRKCGDDDEEDTPRADSSKSTVCFFTQSSNDTRDESDSATVPTEAQFTYSDLLLATDNFSDEHVIGRGGFGTVYRAKLRDGSMVAIKKLLMERGPSNQQGEREFMAEMETLGTITHENLVPLIACCRWGSEKLLVYKLMSNGSLEDWLHGKEQQRSGGAAAELSWDVRVKIARGCAKALGYLHQECKIIHRDVKASNVLLDEDFNAYVTDFGLARELSPGFSHVSTIIAGTLGYVAPEYCHTWRATTKGDVYSFGVVLLELLTGQQPVTCSAARACDGSLVDWVRLLVSQARPAEAWHPVVRHTAAGRFHQVLAFTRLALACTSDRPEQRPSMKEVALALQKYMP